MATLTKIVLAKALVKNNGFSENAAKCFVDDFYNEVRNALESGKHMRLSGFGNFILNDKFPRPGRNPKTGEDIEITARRVVTFKVGKKLKKLIEYNTAITE